MCLPQWWLRKPDRAAASYCETQGLGVFFCAVVMALCMGYKKHDKSEAVAGQQARNTLAAGGLNATEVNE
ncbi:MAG: hypothetical protein KF825_13830 [Ferruginibacter sp.]|nr:hypothetical protein [Bacteroidota bacterium]MBX2935320.1 hypothetical protein [Ferruginibacter sp.]